MQLFIISSVFIKIVNLHFKFFSAFQLVFITMTLKYYFHNTCIEERGSAKVKKITLPKGIGLNRIVGHKSVNR